MARNPLIPEGWKPRPGSVVQVEASRDEPVPPAGLWKVFSAAPDSGTWWLLATGDAARDWAATHSDQVTSGSIVRHSRVLVPKGYRRPAPADLPASALQSMAAGGRR